MSNTFIPYKRFIGSFLPNCILEIKSNILTANDKLVWARLAQHMGDNEYCYPKQELLAEELGIHRQTVIASLKNLVEQGFLKVVTPTPAQRRKGWGNRYYFIEHEVFQSTGRNHRPEEESFRSKSSTLKEESKREIKTPLLSPRKTSQNLSSNFIEVFPKPYQNTPTFVKAWNDFIESRKEAKHPPVTRTAAKIIANKLRTNCKADIGWAIESIKRSSESGYRGVFITERRKVKNEQPNVPNVPPTNKSDGRYFGVEPGSGPIKMTDDEFNDLNPIPGARRRK